MEEEEEALSHLLIPQMGLNFNMGVGGNIQVLAEAERGTAVSGLVESSHLFPPYLPLPISAAPPPHFITGDPYERVICLPPKGVMIHRLRTTALEDGDAEESLQFDLGDDWKQKTRAGMSIPELCTSEKKLCSDLMVARGHNVCGFLLILPTWMLVDPFLEYKLNTRRYRMRIARGSPLDTGMLFQE
ncbi:hypothetical protein STEG23_004370 [Scotinomys teguina]